MNPCSSTVRGLFLAACLGSVAGGNLAHSQEAAAPAPKAQVAADVRAFQAARAKTDPAERLAALRQFVKDYPKSANAGRAETLVFTVLLKNYPDRTHEIDRQARLLEKRAGKGPALRYTRETLAMQMADAEPHGVDLKRAEKMARSNFEITEQRYDADFLAQFKGTAYPVPNAEQIHHRFQRDRAEFLAVLADVELAEGKLDPAAAQLTEAYALDPTNDDVNAIRGRIALARGNKAEALEDFERAQLVGNLGDKWRPKMMELYREAHGGSVAGFTEEMDTRYAQIFQPAFAPGTHPAAPAGHTVLLELYTGSGCGPCVAGDLAMEGVLESYPRTEVVALAFDQHIPEPDPLANPDSRARAVQFGVKFTPTFTLSGEMASIYGGSREESEKAYRGLSGLLDAEAATPGSVKLHLTASAAGDGIVGAKATVEAGSAEQVKQQIARKVVVDPPAYPATVKAAEQKKPAEQKKAQEQKPKAAPPASSSPGPAAAKAPEAMHLVLNFALVEDDVRYSGENGIRFHRMVVRALAKPAGEGFAVEPGKGETLDATFDPASISKKWAEYLTKFEEGNERFDRFEFQTKDTTMNPKHLAVAAWVEDTTSHRVLQAAFAPIGGGA